MAKILLAIGVLALLLVGYIFLQGASATIRFSAKIITWIVILFIVIGASWLHHQLDEKRTKRSDYLESRQSDRTWR